MKVSCGDFTRDEREKSQTRFADCPQNGLTAFLTRLCDDEAPDFEGLCDWSKTQPSRLLCEWVAVIPAST